jgi:hypothetical protein
MTDEELDRRRRRAVKAAMIMALEICPEGEFVFVAAAVNEDELDMTCLSNVPPTRAIELLEIGANDFCNDRAERIQK